MEGECRIVIDPADLEGMTPIFEKDCEDYDSLDGAYVNNGKNMEGVEWRDRLEEPRVRCLRCLESDRF